MPRWQRSSVICDWNTRHIIPCWKQKGFNCECWTNENKIYFSACFGILILARKQIGNKFLLDVVQSSWHLLSLALIWCNLISLIKFKIFTFKFDLLIFKWTFKKKFCHDRIQTWINYILIQFKKKFYYFLDNASLLCQTPDFYGNRNYFIWFICFVCRL